MSNEEIPSVKDALNEYFRLKSKFENELMTNKKKIINNQTLSKREKRAEFLKLMPKCVNCKRPSKKGTIFTVTYYPSTDKIDAYRGFKVSCGYLADPCNLDIQINMGETEPLEKLIENIREEIKTYKDKIIDDKNKLLFGLITTQTAIDNFDFNKSYINSLTGIYETYLDKWNNIVDNQQTKIELEEALVLSYENINQIKDLMKKMKENNNSQFAVDAANIYYTTLDPLLKKIRYLKYSENVVYHDDSSSKDTCKLIQKKFTVSETNVSGYTHKVIAFDVGIKEKKSSKKKQLLVIESDESIELPKEQKEFTIKIDETEKLKPTQEIPRDQPIIGEGKDGISWNIPEYQRLWDGLPNKLKIEFKQNIDWMEEFMYKCVNDRIKPNFQGCRLVIPPNIIVPPNKLPNGQYDFGVSIYNDVFNKQPKSLQDTYLTLYRDDPITKVKNYKMLEDALNTLVEKEVGFDRGFF